MFKGKYETAAACYIFSVFNCQFYSNTNTVQRNGSFFVFLFFCPIIKKKKKSAVMGRKNLNWAGIEPCVFAHGNKGNKLAAADSH